MLFKIIISVALSTYLATAEVETNNKLATVNWFHSKNVCLNTAYHANITVISLKWTLIRFQWYFETARKFSSVLNLDRRFVLEMDQGLNTTVWVGISLSEDHFILQLTATPQRANFTLPSEEQYNSTLTVTTRNGNMTKSAIGKKRDNSVTFTLTFLHRERLRVGRLMDIYSKVVIPDGEQFGKKMVREGQAKLMKDPYEQNLGLVFTMERIRFDFADEEIV